MTDEKLGKKAWRYASDHLLEIKTDSGLYAIAQGYIAGAKENGVFWHDLRKNPEDLPSSYHPVLNEHGEHVFYSKDSESWNRCEGNMRPCHVVAWCEVPRFVKEQGVINV
jgi:hypothetical protein